MKINQYLIFFIVFLFGLIYWVGCPLSPPPQQLEAPLVENPGNDVLTGQEYTIKWNDVTGRGFFTVQESENTSFEPFEFWDTQLTSITISHPNLKEATTYYYRVMAVSESQEYVDSEWSNTVSINVVPIPPEPEIEVLPTSLPFDSVKLFISSQKTFTIKNTGTAVLNITSITAPDDFTVDKSTSFTVSANDSQVVTVTFTPTTAKSYSDDIIIDSDDPDEPHVSVSVSGTGAPPPPPPPAPEIEILHTSLSFGSVTVYASSQKTFTILNTGTAVLNVSSITAPDGFTVHPSTALEVSENGNRIVTVTFSPVEEESYSGNIIINSNDSDEQQVIVSVSGTGAPPPPPPPAPEIEVVPTSLPFGVVNLRVYSHLHKTFTIRNTGTAVLNITSITSPEGFTVDKSTAFTVPENDSLVVTVTFRPTTYPKSYSGNIIINSDDPDEQQVIVNVSGEGYILPEEP